VYGAAQKDTRCPTARLGAWFATKLPTLRGSSKVALKVVKPYPPELKKPRDMDWHPRDGFEKKTMHIITASDHVRRKLWQIYDEIRQTNGAHRHRLAERERRIRRRWLSEQSQKARAGR